MGSRVCGGCTACCTTLAVDAIDKKAGERCKHLNDKGCGIYQTRPEECRQFECAWIAGGGRKAHRPDYSGIVVVLRQSEPGSTLRKRGIMEALQAIAVYPGATRSSTAQSMMRWMSRHWPWRIAWQETDGTEDFYDR